MKKLILAFVLLFTISLFTNCTSELENDETIYESSKSLEEVVSENSQSRISAPSCENRGFKPEPSVPEGSCCMEFNVLESTPALPWEYWVCLVEEYPNVWVEYKSSDYPEGIFKVCLENDDQFYEYSIRYLDTQGETVCESKNQLVYNEKDCDNTFHLCWSANWSGTEEIATFQEFTTIGGMYVINNDGSIDPKHQWFEPELYIVGQMGYIYAMFENTLLTEYDLKPNQVLLDGDCSLCAKGPGYHPPAFVVRKTNFQSIVLYGIGKDEEYAEVPFYLNQWQE